MKFIKILFENSKLSKIFNFIPALVLNLLKDIFERSGIFFNPSFAKASEGRRVFTAEPSRSIRTSAQEIDQNRNLVNFRIISKNTLSIALLFTVGFVDARVVQPGAPRPAAQPQPTQPIQRIVPPVVQQLPIAQPQSYAQALDIIKTKMPSHQVLINNSFTQEFINFVKSVNLSDIETKALLQAGANIHAIWSDNDGINQQILSSLRNNIQSIVPTKPIAPVIPTIPAQPVIPTKPATPIIPTKPIEQKSPITQVHRELLGKVKKLEGFEIYVGAGTSAAGEPIFFALEKLNNENAKVWTKYTKALLDHKQVVDSLRMLNRTCGDPVFLEKQKKKPFTEMLRLDDPYTTELLKQMCPNKAKFSGLFGGDDHGDSIGGGITGLEQMIHRYIDDGDVIYIAYASNQPITGPFKPKKEILLSDFTLEDFEIAYSNIIICVGVDMMPKLKPPISTEHRGIFKNPFNEIRGTYKYIAMKLHGWAGTVEEQFFNKKYMTVFPTYHAAKLLHSSIKNGGLYLGTDKEPFPYDTYYKDPAERELIKKRFPPIKQELIGNAPTAPRGGSLEDLHVFELNALSKYYTGK